MTKTIRFTIICGVFAGAIAVTALAQSTATGTSGSSAAGTGTSGVSGTGSTATESSGTGTSGSGSSGAQGTAGSGSTLGSALGGVTSQMENAVLKHGGKLYQIKDGRPQSITTDTTLPNGAKVDTTGNVTMSDGKSMMIQNDQMLTPAGTVSSAPQTLLNSLPGGGTSTPESSSPAGGTGTSGASSNGTGTSGAPGTGATSTTPPEKQ